MGSEWKTERFGRMAQLVREAVYPSEAVGLSYIGLEHIGEGMLCLVGTGVADDVTSLKSRFRRGDILFGKLRPYFRKVVRAPFDGICSTDIWVVRPRAGVDASFLFYLIASDLFIEPVVRASEGTRMPRAQWAYASSLELPLPPLPEQRAIAHILGTLDDKIELNRRMSETLEQMAQALFKSWFVDFDPVVVNALRAGNPIPEKFAERAARYRENPDALGLPDPILRLFPARFVDSELGEIPEGWEVAIMGNQFRIVMGQSPPGSTYNESRKGSPFYQGRVDFSYRFPQQRVFCTAPTRFAQDGDTLVSVRAPVGSVNMAVERCAIGRGVAAVRHLTGSRSYTYYFVRSLKKIFENFEAEGTVFGAINKDGFNSIKCVVPPIRLVERFDALCKPLDDKIERNERESRTLAALRDALLPGLISGQLRVKDAERFLEERGL